jgi:Tfp pilus assembly protein PilF
LTDDAAELQRERADDLHRRAREEFLAATEGYDEMEPGRGRAFNSMSVVSLYFHDFEAAEREARSALEVQFYTERYSALANLGWAYYQQGNLVEAMTELRQSVMLNPDFCVGHLRLAQVYQEYGFLEPAAEAISRVVGDERCPIPEAHRLHAEIALRMGQEADAAAAYASCVAVAPRSCIAKTCRSAGTATVAAAE